MKKIKLLDSSTINKIAAGEVIERPMSIVKELVENSIDAFSTSIVVEVQKGGKDFIRITDNGSGINKEDLENAFLRHSTSKISKAEDLSNILTMGFRGEALSSIAAVSYVEIVTKTRDSETGIKLVLSGGRKEEKIEVVASNGTTIIVKNLFHNIPVRRNFLKKDSLEYSAIEDIIYKLAIGNKNISFKLIKDGKLVFKTSGNGNLKQSIEMIIGKEFVENTNFLELKKEGVYIKGFLSNTNYTRGNRGYQYIYINGRIIKSLELSKKIEKYYINKIPSNRHPNFIIYIEVDPRYVDVNIHPSKAEVRFSEGDKFFEILEDFMIERFKQSEEIIDLVKENNFKRENIEDIIVENIDLLSLVEKKPKLDFKKSEFFSEKNRTEYFKRDSKEYDETIVKEKEKEYKKQKKSKETILKIPKLRVMGLIFDTYIIAESLEKREVFIIDQHAAHERVLYEKYKEEYFESSVDIQETFLSEKIELTVSQKVKIDNNKDILKKMGFILEDFGENSVVIRGVPNIFGEVKGKTLLIDIIDKLENQKIESIYESSMDKIIKIACTSAIKSGDKKDKLELEKLIEELSCSENPYTCPHGRPTILKYSEKELEKSFKRI